MKHRMLNTFVVLATMLVLLLATAAPAAAQSYTTHRVQPGETLAKIAYRYCTTWQEIYRLNRQSIGPNPNALQSGLALTVVANCGAAHLPERPPTGVYDRGPSTHASGTFRSPYYTAAWGDTLFSIGLRFGVSVSQIQQTNGLSGNYLPAGTTLLIPGAAGSGAVALVPPSEPAPAIERVYFANGAISATRTGIISNGIIKRYILGGRGGRVLEIGTVSHGEGLAVSVSTVDNQPVILNGENNQVINNLWGRLPNTGDYIVSVSPVTRPEGPSLAFDVTFIVQ